LSRLAALFLAGLLTAGAAFAQSTFYEAYALGLEQARSGQLEAARESLRQAIELRAEAGKRIRTYGLNFIDYEPYLPLAEVELELGRLDDAEAHLAESKRQGVADASRLAPPARGVSPTTNSWKKVPASPPGRRPIRASSAAM